MLFKSHNKKFSSGNGGEIENTELLIVVGRGYCSLTPSTRVKYIQCFIPFSAATQSTAISTIRIGSCDNECGFRSH